MQSLKELHSLLLSLLVVVLNEDVGYISISKHTCIKCNNPCDINENYGPQIIVDTSILTDTNYIKSFEFVTRSYNLNRVAKKNYSY